MKDEKKPQRQTLQSRKSRTPFGLIIPILALCLNGCATAPTHEATTQTLTYPQGRQFSPAEQAEAAAEIEAMGCDPDKNKPQECQIPALLTLLKDALSVLDQLAVAHDEFKKDKGR